MRKNDKAHKKSAGKTVKVKSRNKLQAENVGSLTEEMFSGIIAILATGFSAYMALFVFMYLM